MARRNETLPRATAGFCDVLFLGGNGAPENTANRRSRTAKMARQQQVAALHGLGAETLYFIAEIENVENIEATLAAYVRLEDVSNAIRGDQFAPSPHTIDGGVHDRF